LFAFLALKIRCLLGEGAWEGVPIFPANWLELRVMEVTSGVPNSGLAHKRWIGKKKEGGVSEREIFVFFVKNVRKKLGRDV